MNKSKKRICGSMTVGVLIALVIAAPASATLLVDFTLETDKDVYQVGESIYVIYHAHNAGDEDIDPFGQAECWYPLGVWQFENAAGLSREELLADEQPISHGSVTLFESAYDPPLHPGETLTFTSMGPFGGPGKYTLLLGDGPDAFLWGDVTVDYSNAVANFTIVPEPGTLSLLAGLAAAGLLRKARRRSGKRPAGQTLKGACG